MRIFSVRVIRLIALVWHFISSLPGHTLAPEPEQRQAGEHGIQDDPHHEECRHGKFTGYFSGAVNSRRISRNLALTLAAFSLPIRIIIF